MSDTTPQDKVKRSDKQLSDMAIRETLRAATPKAIARLVELLDSKQAAVAMGAAKVILAKVVPDLRSTELKSPDGGAPVFTFVVQSEQAQENLKKLYEGSDSTDD